MKWFEFRQNNSGGCFDHDSRSGIGYAVYIQAVNAENANERASSIGIYFDGREAGLDCPCCGDRWSRASPRNVVKAPPTTWPSELPNLWGIPMYVHYRDGRMVRIDPPSKEQGQ